MNFDAYNFAKVVNFVTGIVNTSVLDYASKSCKRGEENLLEIINIVVQFLLPELTIITPLSHSNSSCMKWQYSCFT